MFGLQDTQALICAQCCNMIMYSTPWWQEQKHWCVQAL